MKDPKRFVENARILGMTFLGLWEDRPPNCRVDMVTTSFSVCGTVACHAGWFAVARGLSRKNLRFFNDEPYEFADSADEMAQFLGFVGRYSLREWAARCPQLWGNTHGEAMFYVYSAFGVPESKLTLKTIGIHWLEVADRVEATL